MHLKTAISVQRADSQEEKEPTAAAPAPSKVKKQKKASSSGSGSGNRTQLQRIRDSILDDINQIRALVLKNLVLQWRQWKTNLCQIVFPALCCAFIFLIQLIFAAINNTAFPADQRVREYNTTSTSMNAVVQQATLYSAASSLQNTTLPFNIPTQVYYSFYGHDTDIKKDKYFPNDNNLYQIEDSDVFRVNATALGYQTHFEQDGHVYWNSTGFLGRNAGITQQIQFVPNANGTYFTISFNITRGVIRPIVNFVGSSSRSPTYDSAAFAPRRVNWSYDIGNNSDVDSLPSLHDQYIFFEQSNEGQKENITSLGLIHFARLDYDGELGDTSQSQLIARANSYYEQYLKPYLDAYLTGGPEAVRAMPSVPVSAKDAGIESWPTFDYIISWDNRSRTAFCTYASSIVNGDCATIMQSGLMNNMHNMILYELTKGRASIVTNVQQVPYTRLSNLPDLSMYMGYFFFPMILLLNLPLFVFGLVYEKESKMRMMQKLSGLRDRNFYCTTFVMYYIIYLVSCALFVIFCAIFGFRFVLETSPAVLLPGLALWGLTLVSFAFFLAAFINATAVANTVGYLFVLFGPLICLFLYQKIFTAGDWSLKPLLLLFPMQIQHFISAILRLCTNSLTCPTASYMLTDVEMISSWISFAASALLYIVLGLYLDNVLPRTWGVARSPLFPIEALYGWWYRWVKQEQQKALNAKMLQQAMEEQQKNKERLQKIKEKANIRLQTTSSPIAAPAGTIEDDLVLDDLEEAMNNLDDEDVLALKELVLTRYDELRKDDDVVLLINNLHKMYGRKHALKGLFYLVKRGQCIGLLGKNGAGKSTTIQILVGMLGATAGDAYVGGSNLHTDPDQIFKKLGYCPQYEIVYESLTPLEHLLFYCRVKGVPLREERKHAQQLLRYVGLDNATLKKRDPLVGSLSGGMKRRLAIAISLVGSPDVVLLDECTTGLDPLTRRQLWRVIRKVKNTPVGDSGKLPGIVLTSHAMEECEALCDSIAIMCYGRMECYGTAPHLKKKWAGGYQLAVKFSEDKRQQAHELVRSVIRDATEGKATIDVGVVADYLGSTVFELPKGGIAIHRVLALLEQARQVKSSDVIIQKYGLSQPKLEDVFLEIVRRADIAYEQAAEKKRKKEQQSLFARILRGNFFKKPQSRATVAPETPQQTDKLEFSNAEGQDEAKVETTSSSAATSCSSQSRSTQVGNTAAAVPEVLVEQQE